MDVTDGMLPCGRAVEQVWDGVGRDPDEHEAGCSYCQDARAGLSEIAQITGDWVAQEEVDGGPKPRASVKDAIMNVVHQELRQGRRIPLETTQYGELFVRESTLAAIVREAAASVPGVHPRRTRVLGTEPWELQVSVSIAAGVLTPAVIEDVRAAVHEALRREVGREVTVRLTVADVHDLDREGANR